MTYNFIYEPTYYSQVIFACMVDARKGTPLANQIGAVIQQQVNQQVNLVNDNTIFYKIEGDYGVLAGYFWITVDNMGRFQDKIPPILRPAYQLYINDINEQISNFIQSNRWQADFLL